MQYLAGSEVSRDQGRPWVVTTSMLLLGAVAALALPSVSLAQGKYSWERYEERVSKANDVTAYGTDMFGEQVSLQNGALSFRVTDVSLPGNNGLSVALTRTYTVKNRQSLPSNDLLADWELELPRISGVFADAWLAANTTTARCSDTRGPMVPSSPAELRSKFMLSDFWQGNQLEIPGGGGGELLLPAAQLRKPTDGHSYVWTANNGQTHLRCLPSIANGAGEGFVAVTPDGTKYTFNWMARKAVPNLREKVPSITGGLGYTVTMPLWETSLYATRVEDRHGNWVQYSYSNTWTQTVKLTGITSSDGRSLTVTYTAANPTRIHQVNDGTRTWNYGYGTDQSSRPSLASVGLPDGTSWGINFSSLSHSPINYVGAENTRSCTTLNDPVNLDLEPVGIITSPAGAVGTFRVGMMQHSFSNVTVTCHNVTISPVNDPSDDEPLFVQSYLSWSLLEKQITGPSLPTMTWSYQYASDWSGHYYGTSSPAVPWCRLGGTCFQPICTSDSCAGTARTLVIGPDGNKTRYVFGNSWQYNVGKLLRVENLDANDAVVQTVTNTYDLSRQDKTYPTRYGTSMRINVDGFESEYHRPQVGAATMRDGVTFSWAANECNNGPCMDYWARPEEVTRASDLDSKLETTTYKDHEQKWILGRVESVAVNGVTITSAYYDPTTGNLLRVYGQGGLLLQTLTYGADGTVATVKDGRDLVTTLSNWYRGVPRNIQFADGTGQSATVNPMGWLTSTTDENGYTTDYAYDAAGRISQVTPPSGDTVAWLPTTRSFTRSSVAQYGLPAGHWRNVVSRGNYRKETYYDGMWRPRMTREYDAGNEAATRRVSVTSYAPGGQVNFTSYPADDAASVSALLQGVWTEYDALGRVRSVSQDSEQGILTTLAEYLLGFKTRVTNPRGYQTVTEYQAFDQPTTDAPVLITQLAGAATEIHRDELGRTTQLKRRSLDGSEHQSRYYVYDNHGRLCKTIEPETGATVVDYDAANNAIWSAVGLDLPNTSNASCGPDRTNAYTSGHRVDRTYDAQNRLIEIDYADGVSDATYEYYPDGALKRLADGDTTWWYEYNKRRLVTRELLVASAGTYEYRWTYNGLGHLASRQSLIGNGDPGVHFAPNALGQPTQADSYATNATYHPNGALKSFTYGNGIQRTVTLNDRQLPQQVRDTLGTTARYDDSITYDDNGNPTEITDALGEPGGTRTMAYDALDRLTYANIAGSGVATWSYDVLDNIRTHATTPASGPTWSRAYHYDVSNRLTSITQDGAAWGNYTYDPRGNMIDKTGQTLVFDRANRLTQIPNVANYEYDGHGRRTSQWRADGTVRVSLYTLDGRLQGEADNRAVGSTDYMYLGSTLVAKRFQHWSGSPPVVTYQHSDGLGSPVLETDANGAVVSRERFLSYGGAVDGAVNDTIGYTGHQEDPASGLVYMQQRYYDPTVGRFLSVDPVTANPNTGAMFNRYNYANNNPYKFTDPDGRQASCAGTPANIIVCQQIAAETGVSAPVAAPAAEKAAGGIIGFLLGLVSMNEASEGGEESSQESGGDVVIPDDVKDQLGERGWTEEEVREVAGGESIGTTVDNTGGKTGDKGEPASVYGSKDGGHVVVNDKSREVIQVTPTNDPDWIPDSRIDWKD